MKKILTIIIYITIVFSCVEEKTNNLDILNSNNEKVDKKTEKDLLNEINKHLESNPERTLFKQTIIPLVEDLKKYNPNKYKMVDIISKKVSKESNLEAFKLGIENLKKELSN